eukprot:1038392-Rhodomonas_salina.2
MFAAGAQALHTHSVLGTTRVSWSSGLLVDTSSILSSNDTATCAGRAGGSASDSDLKLARESEDLSTGGFHSRKYMRTSPAGIDNISVPKSQAREAT